MTTLLHISAHPRGAKSESLAHRARRSWPSTGTPTRTPRFETWDLWDGTLPEFGPAAAHAKMAVFAGADPKGEQAAAWRAARSAFERFAAADAYLFSVPMWNAGIPYILKQFIDVVSQPGMVFSFDPEHGLHRSARPAGRRRVVYTSAVYGPGRPPSFGSDFQAPYLRDWLNWVGIDDITEVEFRPEPGHRRRRDRPAGRARRRAGRRQDVLTRRAAASDRAVSVRRRLTRGQSALAVPIQGRDEPVDQHRPGGHLVVERRCRRLARRVRPDRRADQVAQRGRGAQRVDRLGVTALQGRIDQQFDGRARAACGRPRPVPPAALASRPSSR